MSSLPIGISARREPSSALADLSSVEVVHKRLREAILDGFLSPGQVVSQVKLAAELGVSRTPLREALRLLQSEGLLVAEPNKRVRVSPLTVQDLVQVYCMRISLEAMAIRATVPKLSPEDLAALEGDLAQMSYFMKRGDVGRYDVSHRDFHFRLVGGVGWRVTQIVSELAAYSVRYRRFYQSQRPQVRVARSKSEHRSIVEACILADPEEAARRLATHLLYTAYGLIDLIDPSYDRSALDAAIRTVELRGPQGKTKGIRG
jgi:DNA-binding GntR family transcriptional regulator